MDYNWPPKSSGSGSSAWADLTGVPAPVAALLGVNTGDQTLASLGGANTALSNLTTTSLNTNLLPSGLNTRDLGSTSLAFKDTYTRRLLLTNATGIVGTFKSVGLVMPSGATPAFGIQNSNSQDMFGIYSNSNSNNDAAVTGDLRFETGNKTVGTANTGSIVFRTGTATGSRGQLQFIDGSEGTAGQVWTSIDTAGNGHWAASAAPQILALQSNPSSGGAVSEAMTVTGLLTTDTILAVTQMTQGGATRTSLPLIGWDTVVTGGLTAHWVADPGVGAVLLIAVKR